MTRLFILFKKEDGNLPFGGYEDTVMEYINVDGYSQLRKCYSHKLLFKELDSKNEEYLVIDHKDLEQGGLKQYTSLSKKDIDLPIRDPRDIDPRDVARIRLLLVLKRLSLEEMDIDHDYPPWIDDKAFSRIVEIVNNLHQHTFGKFFDQSLE